MSDSHSRVRRSSSSPDGRDHTGSRRPRAPSPYHHEGEPRPKIQRQLSPKDDRPSTSSRGPAPSTGEKEPPARKPRIDRYEIVHTRPEHVNTKVGQTGRPISLQANYFRLLTGPTWRIYQYHVDFTPEIEMRRLRSGILSEQKDLLGGYLYDGMKVFTTAKLREDVTVKNVTSKKGEEYTITIKYVGVISMTEWQSLQVLNIILRRAMEGLKLQTVGRHFYDPRAKVELRDHPLVLWPGYQTSVRQCERDIMICVEITHKVMRTESVYDILRKCTEESRDYHENFKSMVLGMVVLTDYNNRTYRVSDVDFNANPRSTFECKGEQVSFIDYYKKRYQLRIRDPNQPLLISKPTERQIRGGKNEFVTLIPELVKATGLTDAMRTNFTLMRALADHTRMNPDRRIERLHTFNRRLQETKESVQVLNDWNMTMERNMITLQGRVIDPQAIVFFDRMKHMPENSDWTKAFREKALFKTPSRGLDRWVVITPNRNARDCRTFVESLMRAANGMKFSIRRPRELAIYDDRNHSYMQAIEDGVKQDPQLLLILVPNNNADRYGSIKKKTCVDRAVPSQIITQKVAGNQRGLMSVATKVAIQINSKLGYTPWMIELPLTGLMTIGYDIARGVRDKTKAYGALVATMDMKTNPTFYSTVAACHGADQLSNELSVSVFKALRQFQREHEKLPARILIYRDGVGEGSLHHILEFEVKDLVAKLEKVYKEQGDKPLMLAYVIVNKQINTRFFAKGMNPPSGTVVDDVVTLPERYDYFLVSQSVRQGTVSPTSYNVLHSTIKLTPDQLQVLTFKMTHLYYNWSGTTRVPAVCQYAKKLATLVSQNISQIPSNVLEKKLYYL